MDNWWVILIIALVVIGALALFIPKAQKPKKEDKPAPSVTKTDPSATKDSLAPPETGAEPEPAVDDEPAAPAEFETPEPTQGRMTRLRSRLARSGSPLGSTLLKILSRDHLSEEDWEEIEETLLVADVGTTPAMELVDRLREEVRVQGISDPGKVRELLREELMRLVDPAMDRSLALEKTTQDDGTEAPAVVMVVGVNGTGKTTTVGKLARVLVADEKQPILGAADTFRAAAAEQLTTWGRRVGVQTVRSDKEGADPASVAFEAVEKGRQNDADVVLIDTAGRLQNKANLMDELGKIKRVASRKGPINEVLLVLDATTGQNGLVQAKVFSEVVDVTGVVLTKLDGTAKGGIVIAVQRELGVPVKLVGLGEGADDLAPFETDAFVDGLLGAD